MDDQHEESGDEPTDQPTATAGHRATAAPLPVVALAASAGGLRALSRLLERLPADLPAAMVVLQHLAPDHVSQLAPILARRTALGVVQATAGQHLEPGVVVVAPPAHHLKVAADDTLALSDEGAVHFVRPAADVLFDSIAEHLGARAIVAVLTGTGEDGSSSLCRVQEHGGTVVVEDPTTAEFAGMPRAAVRTGCVDHVLELDEIPALIERLVHEART